MFFTPAQDAAFRADSAPAPIGGLNARDSLIAMPSTDAILFRNWWPQPYGASVRKGYRQRNTGFPAPVESLMTWISPTGITNIFAFSATSMYNATTGGAIGAAVLTGLSNALWQSVSLNNAAGPNTIAVNGFDDAILVNPAGAVSRIIAGGGGAGTWAGVAPSALIQLTVHQRRLWGVQKDTTYGWYLPADAINGTFIRYDFGPLFTRGGSLAYLTTWTLDDGNGAEDHLVAVSTQGDAVVYAGLDPNSSATWSLVGVYFIGAPVAGRRAFTKAGGDLLVLTQQGAVSMAELLVSTKVNQAENPLTSRKIQFLMSELVSTYGDLNGWDLDYFPRLNMLLANIPTPVTGGNLQLAANQLIGSWGQFTNMDALCWTTVDSSPIFGARDNTIYDFWVGFKDKVLFNNTGGTGVYAEAQSAFSYLGKPSQQKQIGMYRPNFVVGLPIAYKSAIFYDFQLSNLATPDVTPPVAGARWDSALWGASYWGGGTEVQREWVQAQGVGNAVSFAFAVQAEVSVLWVSTDYVNIQGDGVF